MKIRKLVKATKMLALSMIVSLAVQTAVPVFQSNELTVQAATKTVKLNATKKTLTVGKTFRLKISGTTKKVTWSSNKKSVATVSKKGLVTAKAAGTATITAKVNNKKYTCKITVKEVQNSYLENAPFEAKELQFGAYSTVIPTSLEIMDLSFEEDSTMLFLYPADEDLAKVSSMIMIISLKSTDEESLDYTKLFEEPDVAEAFKENITSSLGEGETMEDFSLQTVKKDTKEYTQCKYKLVYKDEAEVPNIMDMYFYINDGYVTIISEISEEGDTKLGDFTDYLLTSLTLKK